MDINETFRTKYSEEHQEGEILGRHNGRYLYARKKMRKRIKSPCLGVPPDLYPGLLT